MQNNMINNSNSMQSSITKIIKISVYEDVQKEIARLKRELRDAQDALDVLKKAINILEKRREAVN